MTRKVKRLPAKFRVVLTRPAGRNRGLQERLEAQGAICAERPLIEIQSAIESVPYLSLKASSAADVLIAVSPNAVKYGLEAMRHHELALPKVRITVGPSTARALEAAGYSAVFNQHAVSGSEGVLALAQLQNVQDKRISIWRGSAGRALMGDTLLQRGADVHYVDLYTREMPCFTRQQAEGFSSEQCDVAIVTSGHGLRNLRRIEKRFELPVAGRHLVLGSERIAGLAVKTGCAGEQYTVALEPTDEALATAVITAAKIRARDPGHGEKSKSR